MQICCAIHSNLKEPLSTVINESSFILYITILYSVFCVYAEVGTVRVSVCVCMWLCLCHLVCVNALM